MSAVKSKLHELVDALSDDQAERALDVLEDPTPFLDEVPPGMSEEDPGFWKEIERRAQTARSGTSNAAPWAEVRERLLARHRGA